MDRLTPEQEKVAVARRRQRSIVTALLLVAFVVLVFAIAIAKIRTGHE